MNDKMKELGVPPVREYLEMLVRCRRQDVCLQDVGGYDRPEQGRFRPRREDIVTAGDFMDMTEGAQIIFI